jgi:hypothetical protein
MPTDLAYLNFRERRRFEEYARQLVRLPEPGEGPLNYLLAEARWQELLCQAADPEDWLMALSQATGVYFFPSREWPPLFLRYLKLLGVQRLLEAGAGRGYLTGALTSLTAAAGLSFKALDKGEGEYRIGLPVHPKVETDDVFSSMAHFRPDVVLYAWPPPEQSVAPLLQFPSLRYLIVVGEAGGGITGAREDWLLLPHKKSAALSRFSRGRTGQTRHQVTMFWSGAGG